VASDSDSSEDEQPMEEPVADSPPPPQVKNIQELSVNNNGPLDFQ
jgi:hypothetical protein